LLIDGLCLFYRSLQTRFISFFQLILFLMKVFVLGLLAVFWGSSALGKTLYTFNGGGTTGNWNSANTWTTDPTGSTRVGQSVPVAGDDVVVTNSFTVSVTSQVIGGLKITIQRGGVLDLAMTGTTNAFSSTLSRLAGQGTLRVARAYFPAVTTNDFDDANTGTVEFYDLSGTTTLPLPSSGQYNNVRLLNTTTTAYTAQLDNDLTLNGNLSLVRTAIPTGTPPPPTVTLNLGKADSDPHTLTVLGDITVGTGTVLGISNANARHTLNAGGSFVNNGTVDLYNSQLQNALLNFTGGTDANFACNGPTDLSVLRLNKGIDSQVLLNITATGAEPRPATSGC
jgi:fibronectin-binding autotransporter adhesin